MSATEATIKVTRHALEQGRGRFREELSADELEQAIAAEVAAAFAAGRVANHKQPGFLLYRQKARTLPSRQRFVWSADEKRAWIVDRASGEGTITVVTSLSRAGVNR